MRKLELKVVFRSNNGETDEDRNRRLVGSLDEEWRGKALRVLMKKLESNTMRATVIVDRFF